MHAFVVDIQMRHQPDRRRIADRQLHLRRVHVCAQRIELLRRHFDKHHVGVLGGNDETWQAAQRVGQPRGTCMILGQPCHMVVERMQARGGQQAGLAHAATADLAPAARLVDQRVGAQQHRADRRAEPLRQAHRDAVEILRELARRHALRHRRVVQPRAVEMQRQAAAVAQRTCIAQVVQRQRPAVPGVLQAQQPGAGEMRVVRLDRALHRVERQRAIGRVHKGLRLDRAQHRGTAAFVFVGVGVHADEVFVAALAVRHQRQQVGLGAAGHEQAGLEAEIVGQTPLQRVDGRILAVDVVADLGARDRLAHRRRGAGDGVAAQVDPVHRCKARGRRLHHATAAVFPLCKRGSKKHRCRRDDPVA